MRDENSYKGLAEMIYLCRKGRRINRVVEIGSFMGESAFLFACNFPEVHCVDPWDYKEDGTYSLPPGATVAIIEEVFDGFCQKFPNTIVKHKGKSTDIVKTWNMPIDLLYIDGDHSYDGVMADIGEWAPHVVPGGYICGHDYDDPRYPGVRDAVLWHFPHLPVITYRDRSWSVRKEGV